MGHLLITGATGNVGSAVVRHLLLRGVQVVAAVRQLHGKDALPTHPNLRRVAFDFADPATLSTALAGAEALFLMRPPQLADVDRYFVPLLDLLRRHPVKHLVFLSVQGAEKSKLIPHYRIEAAIRERNLSFTILRPSYFMQNLTTTLYPGIRERGTVAVPAGRAVFNWVDADNVGEVAAVALCDYAQRANRVLDVTGSENLTFPAALDRINSVLDRPIRYRSVHPLAYLWHQRRRGVTWGNALTVAAIHYLQRFQSEPVRSQVYTTLTGKEPTTLAAFARRERRLLDA